MTEREIIVADNMPKNEEEWKEKLTPGQYEVLRMKGTETPFTSKLLDMHDDGMFYCVACGAPLFLSSAKFDSGTGWPSFDTAAGNVELRPDDSDNMHRTEAVCKNCGGHLGHLFDDGPTATGKRFCINGCTIDFKPKEQSS